MGASGYAAIATFAALYLASRGMAYPVLVLAAYGTAYVGIRLVAGHWPDRYGPRRVGVWSALVEAGGLVLVAVAPDLPLGPAGGAGNLCAAVLGGLIVGSGLSLLYPSLALIVINRTDKAQQGAALGTYTSFWDLGILVWGPATGLVARMAGYPALYMVTTASAVVSAILVLTLAAVPGEADARSGMSARRTGAG
jgi:MFS family permease